MQEHTAKRRIARAVRCAAWTLAVIAVIVVAAIFILKDDDCWPEPEPVPADCKPGQLCPVAGTTGAWPVVVEPILPAESGPGTTAAP